MMKYDDILIVNYDSYPPDIPVLCIARREGDNLRMLNVVQGDEALDLYRKLIGDDNK